MSRLQYTYSRESDKKQTEKHKINGGGEEERRSRGVRGREEEQVSERKTGGAGE